MFKKPKSKYLLIKVATYKLFKKTASGTWIEPEAAASRGRFSANLLCLYSDESLEGVGQLPDLELQVLGLFSEGVEPVPRHVLRRTVDHQFVAQWWQTVELKC